jgi:hypothetical protein
MKRYIKLNFLLFFISLIFNSVPAVGEVPAAKTQFILPNELMGYENYSPIVKKIIFEAAILAHKNLTYLYGSANPQQGGMDCSGTISYLLKLFLPDIALRQADEMYKWVWQKGKFYAVNGNNFKSFEFEKLQPGDLLFWSGTYETVRDPPITHVMLYLGKNKAGKPLAFGASNGRSYNGNIKCME